MPSVCLSVCLSQVVRVKYPAEGPHGVRITEADFKLLQPDEFLNDSLIDFYINWLKDQVLRVYTPQLVEQFHFFSSFFFTKLSMEVKKGSKIQNQLAQVQAVRKYGSEQAVGPDGKRLKSSGKKLSVWNRRY
eukprot:SAG22_NODE_11456_length_484_cov_0.945455_1_plen_131_part_10